MKRSAQGDGPRKVRGGDKLYDGEEGNAPAPESLEDLEYEDPNEEPYVVEEDGPIGGVVASGDVDLDGDSDDDDDGDADDGAAVGRGEPLRPVWVPSAGAVEKDEELIVDATAYEALHSFKTEWPTLSFAPLQDTFGLQRRRFPHDVLLACGTQAEEASQNKLFVLLARGLRRNGEAPIADGDDDAAPEVDGVAAVKVPKRGIMKRKPGEKPAADDSDDDDDDDDDDAGDDDDEDSEGNERPPDVSFKAFRHQGSVNRVKEMPQRPGILATIGEAAAVAVYDVQGAVQYLCKEGRPGAGGASGGPKQVLTGHGAEGWALDWSPVSKGRIVSGDEASFIYVWEPREGGEWAAGAGVEPYQGHSGSVEDVQWSPAEADVFVSCSADRTVKIWDARQRRAPALSFNGHASEDVNVLDWNKRVNYLLATGNDDGSFCVWDVRTLSSAGGGAAPQPSAVFNWHREPIAGIEWSPDEESVLAVTSDFQCSVWDLSLEPDDAEATLGKAVAGDGTAVPHQLLFVHAGQREFKEVHFHKQIPGLIMTTAEDSLAVWKAANV